MDAYQRNLRRIWWLSMGISIVRFCLVWVERSIPLRKELDTHYEFDAKTHDDSHKGGNATD